MEVTAGSQPQNVTAIGRCICVSDELYTIPGMQKDASAVQERKPSSISNDSEDSRKDNTSKGDVRTTNWSCNAGDSGATKRSSATGVDQNVRERNWSSNAKDDVVLQQESSRVVENNDFDFKLLPPSGLCLSQFTGS